MDERNRRKQQAAKAALAYVKSGMVLGLGSGSTVHFFLEQLAEAIPSRGLDIKGVASSKKTERMAAKLGIPLIEMDEVSRVDVAIDGTDLADRAFQLIKGGGGSLFREKMVLGSADFQLIIMEKEKWVSQITGQVTVPVEVVPFGWSQTVRKLQYTGATCVRRVKEGRVFVSDNGNYIIDCTYPRVADLQDLHSQLKMTLGVVETGIFLNTGDLYLIGNEDASVTRYDRESTNGEGGQQDGKF